MRPYRLLWLVPALLLVGLSFDASAQGRGKAAKVKAGKNGNGPAFCRSGAGHPVFGWEWCRDRGWDSAGNRNADRRAVPRQPDSYPDRYRDRRVDEPAFDNGYADGYEKGLDDGRDRRGSDPTRHAWYRSANRNYDPSHGSRAQYANAYREGFRAGYDAGFADGERYGTDSQTRRFPWPF